MRAGRPLGALALAPLAILFVLNLVDEFDRVAFAALAPEIRSTFGLSDAGISTVRAVAGVLTLLAAVPIGILADRTDRVRASVVAGGLWGISAVLTAVVPGVALLYLVRFGSGLGRITNEVVHPSLLADYYPSTSHPRVFAVHRMANAVAPAAGILAGYSATAFGWQAAFLLLAIPTGIAVLAATRLREPRRHAATAPAAGGDTVPFVLATRTLFSTPLLTRLWTAAFCFGVATLQLDTLISLFFERVWDFGSVGRGYVQFGFGVGVALGLAGGARYAERLVAAGQSVRLPRAIGRGAAPLAVGLVTLAVAPSAPIAVLGVVLVGIGYGGYQPAYYSVVGAAAPERLRSQAYGWAIVSYGIGGLAYLLLFGAFGGEDGNYRGLAAALAVVMALAAALAHGATRRGGSLRSTPKPTTVIATD